jgi:hypothetical protein
LWYKYWWVGNASLSRAKDRGLILLRLIALLLGRLRLSASEAIDKYRVLAKYVFSKRKAPGKDGTFKASKLEKAIKDVVEGKLGRGHADERMFMAEGCKTYDVSTLSKRNS